MVYSYYKDSRSCSCAGICKAMGNDHVSMETVVVVIMKCDTKCDVSSYTKVGFHENAC